MFGFQDLKPKIVIDQTTIECPVNGCQMMVERQRRIFKREGRFRCPEHNIFISPSTFEYADYTDNLLWKSETDLQLLKLINAVKRESRMGRDNSEDALTWNVFRHLEYTNTLDQLLSYVTQIKQSQTELIYWSYSKKENNAWSELNKARREFGEDLPRSSEPDLIAVTNKTIFFIEAKLIATNNTLPSDPNEHKKYETGGRGWYEKVFASPYDVVAIQSKKYELLRFWLLGTWLATILGRNFCLLNVVPSKREIDIEVQFIPHIKVDAQNQFKRLGWEEIYNYIVENMPHSDEKRKLSEYFQNKTIGYNHLGLLQKAFTTIN